jgi:hypothetical protein
MEALGPPRAAIGKTKVFVARQRDNLALLHIIYQVSFTVIVGLFYCDIRSLLLHVSVIISRSCRSYVRSFTVYSTAISCLFYCDIRSLLQRYQVSFTAMSGFFYCDIRSLLLWFFYCDIRSLLLHVSVIISRACTAGVAMRYAVQSVKKDLTTCQLYAKKDIIAIYIHTYNTHRSLFGQKRPAQQGLRYGTPAPCTTRCRAAAAHRARNAKLAGNPAAALARSLLWAPDGTPQGGRRRERGAGGLPRLTLACAQLVLGADGR